MRCWPSLAISAAAGSLICSPNSRGAAWLPPGRPAFTSIGSEVSGLASCAVRAERWSETKMPTKSRSPKPMTIANLFSRVMTELPCYSLAARALSSFARTSRHARLSDDFGNSRTKLFLLVPTRAHIAQWMVCAHRMTVTMNSKLRGSHSFSGIFEWPTMAARNFADRLRGLAADSESDDTNAPSVISRARSFLRMSTKHCFTSRSSRL